VQVSVERCAEGATITVAVAVTARTGVEMEAMTGAAIGALTLYDMVKGIDRSASVIEVALIEKTGGRSGVWRRE
jgi:cyclic pyranopterin phosphate synthase